MDNCKFKSISNIKFCSSLVELSFNGCELSQFENVSWTEEEEEEEDNDNSHSSSPNLKYLNLSQNDLTHFKCTVPINPSSIEFINE